MPFRIPATFDYFLRSYFCYVSGFATKRKLNRIRTHKVLGIRTLKTFIDSGLFGRDGEPLLLKYQINGFLLESVIIPTFLWSLFWYLFVSPYVNPSYVTVARPPSDVISRPAKLAARMDLGGRATRQTPRGAKSECSSR